MSLQGFDFEKEERNLPKESECCRAIPVEVERKIKEHSEICDYLKNLYKTKNADYGDSMHPLFNEYGLTAFLVMFDILFFSYKSIQTLKKEKTHVKTRVFYRKI